MAEISHFNNSNNTPVDGKMVYKKCQRQSLKKHEFLRQDAIEEDLLYDSKEDSGCGSSDLSGLANSWSHNDFRRQSRDYSDAPPSSDSNNNDGRFDALIQVQKNLTVPKGDKQRPRLQRSQSSTEDSKSDLIMRGKYIPERRCSSEKPSTRLSSGYITGGESLEQDDNGCHSVFDDSGKAADLKALGFSKAPLSETVEAIPLVESEVNEKQTKPENLSSLQIIVSLDAELNENFQKLFQGLSASNRLDPIEMHKVITEHELSSMPLNVSSVNHYTLQQFLTEDYPRSSRISSDGITTNDLMISKSDIDHLPIGIGSSQVGRKTFVSCQSLNCSSCLKTEDFYFSESKSACSICDWASNHDAAGLTEAEQGGDNTDLSNTLPQPHLLAPHTMKPHGIRKFILQRAYCQAMSYQHCAESPCRQGKCYEEELEKCYNYQTLHSCAVCKMIASEYWNHSQECPADKCVVPFCSFFKHLDGTTFEEHFGCMIAKPQIDILNKLFPLQELQEIPLNGNDIWHPDPAARNFLWRGQPGCALILEGDTKRRFGHFGPITCKVKHGGHKTNKVVITKVNYSKGLTTALQTLHLEKDSALSRIISTCLWYRQISGEKLLVCSTCLSGIDMETFLGNIKNEEIRLDYMLKAIHVAMLLHTLGIIYLNWKLDHLIILQGSGQLQVCNFAYAVKMDKDGESRELSELPESYVEGIRVPDYVKKGLDPRIAPPEVLDGRHVSRRSDTWGLGCLLYQIFHRRRCLPYPDLRHHSVECLLKRRASHMSPNSSDVGTVQHILEKCWAVEQDRRPFPAQLEVDFKHLY